ncbi:MAG: TolC family protein [Planctomycetes bacterium]|jgi:outer membrane protein, heavy metal efflux system|nr:TolC family protein [Planctomycetota bacterium]MBT6451579.1 TolC family protein [Planctomycetota bacterium]MBT6540681.1 TolC family protein [Planctomycetota bacterium]MBT6784015.1 TolC family protein [Planctomycetota bacterium]MBT6967758.1 TolC family protein [Planctomycetota bacterium]
MKTIPPAERPPRSLVQMTAMAMTLCLLPGCSSPPAAHNLSGPPPTAFPLASVDPNGSESSVDPAGVLSLRDVLSLTLLHNPELASFSWQIRASEAVALQEGLSPNPELEAEIENFAGSDTLGGFDEAESTISISQLIELGGKKALRVRVAQLGTGLAAWEYQSQRLEVLTRASMHFIDVLAGQRQVELKSASLDLALEMMNGVSARIEAGKSSPLERTRAQVVVAQGRISLEQAKRSLESSRVLLASCWGKEVAQFPAVRGSLEQIHEVPEFDLLTSSLDENPTVSRWDLEISERRARIDLAAAEAVPDVTVSGGARLFQGTDETALLVGVSLPIPVFHRNQGLRREAEYNLSIATEKQRAVRVQLFANLHDSYQQLLSAYREVTALRDEVIPAAKSAYDGVQESYRQGKLAQLDVLDSQKTLFEVRDQYTRALTDYHRARSQVEGLLGKPISELKKGGSR